MLSTIVLTPYCSTYTNIFVPHWIDTKLVKTQHSAYSSRYFKINKSSILCGYQVHLCKNINMKNFEKYFIFKLVRMEQSSARSCITSYLNLRSDRTWPLFIRCLNGDNRYNVAWWMAVIVISHFVTKYLIIVIIYDK